MALPSSPASGQLLVILLNDLPSPIPRCTTVLCSFACPPRTHPTYALPDVSHAVAEVRRLMKPPTVTMVQNFSRQFSKMRSMMPTASCQPNAAAMNWLCRSYSSMASSEGCSPSLPSPAPKPPELAHVDWHKVGHCPITWSSSCHRLITRDCGVRKLESSKSDIWRRRPRRGQPRLHLAPTSALAFLLADPCSSRCNP